MARIGVPRLPGGPLPAHPEQAQYQRGRLRKKGFLVF
jgi:hypothetical protein